MCASLWRKWDENSKIAFISLLPCLFHFVIANDEEKDTCCPSSKCAINKSNLLCGKISFEICVVHTSSNCTRKQQNNIRKNDKVSRKDKKLRTRYNY